MKIFLKIALTCTLTLRLTSSNSHPPLRVDLPSREVRKVTAANCSTRFNTAGIADVERRLKLLKGVERR
jgi:hypothetical protein